MSSVDWIVLCPEFSTGTTPKSAAPEATSSNTSSTLASGSALAECPKCLCTACCENVPSGPRYPTFSGSCCARQADMISRNRRTSPSSDSGPSLQSTTQIGCASCIERVCQDVYISVVAVFLQTKQKTKKK